MALPQSQDGITLPRRFVDLEKWDKKLYDHDGSNKPGPAASKPVTQVTVSIGGPYKGGLAIPEGACGWNAGDIDFRADGAIFIRNPYLADAIERHLQAAYKAKKDDKWLMIVRDEGWSGTQTNIIC
jgi:hypothetical protein